MSGFKVNTNFNIIPKTQRLQKFDVDGKKGITKKDIDMLLQGIDESNPKNEMIISEKILLDKPEVLQLVDEIQKEIKSEKDPKRVKRLKIALKRINDYLASKATLAIEQIEISPKFEDNPLLLELLKNKIPNCY